MTRNSSAGTTATTFPLFFAPTAVTSQKNHETSDILEKKDSGDVVVLFSPQWFTLWHAAPALEWYRSSVGPFGRHHRRRWRRSDFLLPLSGVFRDYPPDRVVREAAINRQVRISYLKPSKETPCAFMISRPCYTTLHRMKQIVMLALKLLSIYSTLLGTSCIGMSKVSFLLSQQTTQYSVHSTSKIFPAKVSTD